MGEVTSFLPPTNTVDGDPSTSSQNLVQVLFLGAVYGYILLLASNTIGGGSELLLLTPYAPIIGSIILPFLGGVPDGMMVLFSGLGKPTEEAQESLKVGIGALAGSSILALSMAFGVMIIAGRVDLDDNGDAIYTGKPKITKGFFNTGISVEPYINNNGWWLLITSISLVLVQGFCYANNIIKSGAGAGWQKDKYFIITGFVSCILLFLLYMIYQYNASMSDNEQLEDKIEKTRAEALKEGHMNFNQYYELHKREVKNKVEDYNQDLIQDDKAIIANLVNTQYDKWSKSNHFSEYSLEHILKEVGLGAFTTHHGVQKLWDEIDVNKDGKVSKEELTDYFYANFIQKDATAKLAEIKASDEDDEEEEEIPEDLKDLDPETRISKVIQRSLYMMFCGTVVVLLFSDPMVDVLGRFGEITGVEAFFVSFILAPLASNAPEILASVNYASKRTKKSISISLSNLQGVACMNITFALAIFYLLFMLDHGLKWEFTAESTSLLMVQLVMTVVSFKKSFSTLWAILIIILYPLSLGVVAVMEYGMGIN